MAAGNKRYAQGKQCDITTNAMNHNEWLEKFVDLKNETKDLH